MLSFPFTLTFTTSASFASSTRFRDDGLFLFLFLDAASLMIERNSSRGLAMKSSPKSSVSA